MKYKIMIEPMGAVRTTQRQKFADPNARRYASYKQMIGWQLRKASAPLTNETCRVHITFHMPIPASWRIAKRQSSVGTYHRNKPDIDNLIKGVFDAANTILWRDDQQVVECSARKVYSIEPFIEIEVEEVNSA